MSECAICGKEVSRQCVSCGSGHVVLGTLEFVWNGFLAKRVEVCWCARCDEVWFVGFDGERQPICHECRDRALAVAIPEQVRSDAA